MGPPKYGQTKLNTFENVRARDLILERHPLDFERTLRGGANARLSKSDAAQIARSGTRPERTIIIPQIYIAELIVNLNACLDT